MVPIPDGQEEVVLPVPTAIELEEYKQVLNERQFIMTRFMQAVGLYLTLSGFALKELMDSHAMQRVWLLTALFTILNAVALFVARRFRDMANHAMIREIDFVERYHVKQTHDLFWGYYASIALVCGSQVSIAAVACLKVVLPDTDLGA